MVVDTSLFALMFPSLSFGCRKLGCVSSECALFHFYSLLTFWLCSLCHEHSSCQHFLFSLCTLSVHCLSCVPLSLWSTGGLCALRPDFCCRCQCRILRLVHTTIIITSTAQCIRNSDLSACTKQQQQEENKKKRKKKFINCKWKGTNRDWLTNWTAVVFFCSFICLLSQREKHHY